jgi:hypothetical protein
VRQPAGALQFLRTLAGEALLVLEVAPVVPCAGLLVLDSPALLQLRQACFVAAIPAPFGGVARPFALTHVGDPARIPCALDVGDPPGLGLLAGPRVALGFGAPRCGDLLRPAGVPLLQRALLGDATPLLGHVLAVLARVRLRTQALLPRLEQFAGALVADPRLAHLLLTLLLLGTLRRLATRRLHALLRGVDLRLRLCVRDGAARAFPALVAAIVLFLALSAGPAVIVAGGGRRGHAEDEQGGHGRDREAVAGLGSWVHRGSPDALDR